MRATHTTARRRSALVAGTGIALLVAGAPAAASWSPPDALSSSSADIGRQPTGTPTLGIDARGNALATWARSFGRGWRLALRPAGGSAFGPERPAPYLGDEVVDRELPTPLVYGSGQAVALEQQKGDATCGGLATRYALTARTGPTLARSRKLATILSHQQPAPLAFAGNRGGAALAAWIEYPRDARGRCVKDRREVLRAAAYRPGRGFGAPVTLRRGLVSQLVAVAVGQSGDALVVIRRRDGLETRSRRPSGHWGPVRRLTIADERVDVVRAAIAPDGAAWLLWSSARSGVRTVSAAVRRPHATRFGSVRTLDRGALPDELRDSPERWRLRIATPERGTGATAAWTSWDGAHLRVMLADARGAEPLAPRGPVTPDGEHHVLGDLALGAGRRAIAVMSRPAEGPARGLVAVARGSAPFGALEPVGEGSGRLSGQALAINPVTRQPGLAWVEVRPATPSPRATVFASTRR
jgi:hypothetical protein